MTLLYTVLAADPATPAPLLERLSDLGRTLRQATGVSGAHTATSREGSQILAALARNPALPATVRTSLEQQRGIDVRCALLSRPGATVAEALTLLRGETRTRVLRHAVTAVPDPTGQLAEHTMAANSSKGLLADIMDATTITSVTARLAAANRMLTERNLTAVDAQRVAAVLRRHPQRALEVATDPTVPTVVYDALAPQRRQAAAATPDTIAPGRVTTAKLAAWLAAPGRTTEEVAAFVRADGRTAALRTAVAGYLDPTGQVAAAALEASADRKVATAVLVTPNLPTAVRAEAARRVVAPGTGLTYPYAAAVADLVRADATLAADVARVTGDRLTLRATMEHLSLPPAAVAAVADRLLDTSSNVGVLARDWVWLATHPSATTQLRVRALAELEALVGCTLEEHRAGERNAASWLLELAAAGIRADEVGLVAAGETLPCPAIRALPSWRGVPGALAMVQAAVTAQLTGLDSTLSAQVLTALAGDFTGTIGELATAVTAVAA